MVQTLRGWTGSQRNYFRRKNNNEYLTAFWNRTTTAACCLIMPKMPLSETTDDTILSVKNGPWCCGFCPLRGILRCSIGAYLFCCGLMDVIEACWCWSYDAVSPRVCILPLCAKTVSNLGLILTGFVLLNPVENKEKQPNKRLRIWYIWNMSHKTEKTLSRHWTINQPNWQ